jgi:sulfur-oxidizing protein SoxY
MMETDMPQLTSFFTRTSGIRKTLLPALALLAAAATHVQADESEQSWLEMRDGLFNHRPIADGSAILSLTAPVRAEEPALVPVEIKDLRPAGAANRIKILTLIVDENPAPVAAVFTLAPGAQLTALETRIRVNAYSFVRVVAEMEDGSLQMIKRYVKATGGCAAPASKNPDESIATMGQMRLRHYASGGDETELQLQIRHPNYSGLQMDQLTGLYRPAHFVSTIQLMTDGKPFMSVEGAISLSENPILRFKYRGSSAKAITAHVEDSEGKTFDQSWDAAGKPVSKGS